MILRDHGEQMSPTELAHLVSQSNLTSFGSLFDTKQPYATTLIVNNAQPELPWQRGLNCKECAKLRWHASISFLLHQRGNDRKALCNKFPGYKRAYASYLSALFRISIAPPFLNGGVTTHQVIHHQKQRKHKETNSRKGTKGGRMCPVYSTYTTPSGDSRGRERTNNAGVNYCIHTAQKIKSWNHLNREP